jgi:hypothetical protein
MMLDCMCIANSTMEPTTPTMMPSITRAKKRGSSPPASARSYCGAPYCGS